MIKDWEEIDGFFWPNHHLAYLDLVLQHPKGKMVEVGTWKGRSFASVVPLCKLLKYILIVCVDTWKGSPTEIGNILNPGPHYEAVNNDIYQIFKQNMTDLGLMQDIIPLQLTSIEASKLFINNSLDLVFIDASHEFEEVDKDIRAWFPKINRGGTIAGHDINYESVEAAVNKNFPNIYKIKNNCWSYRKTGTERVESLDE